MLGKIIQLKNQIYEDGFKVIDGLEFSAFGNADFRFAILSVGCTLLRENQHVVYCWDIITKQDIYGYKDFLVNAYKPYGQKPEAEFKEEVLWVLVPYAPLIKTEAEKIAGRYPEEGIFKMHVGDTIVLQKKEGIPETYMAVRAGNEMVLVKKNR